MAIREGRWDCQYCGTIGILGRHKDCTNCGHSRPEGTRFYLAEDAEIVEKNLERQARLGPDWVCEFCGTSNTADKIVCGSCGAPREGTSPQQEVKEYVLGEAPTSGDMTFETDPGEDKPEPAAVAKKALPIVAIVGGLLLICVVAIVAFAIFSGRNVDATVSGFEWQRALEVEAFQTVTEEDWSIPQGGRSLSQRQEIHHYDQILDHYETRQREVSEQVQVGMRTYVCGQRDLGNGFFEDIECSEPEYETRYRTETYEEPIYRDEPVYQTLYTYEIDKWIVVRTEQSSGRDHQPFWPRGDLSGDEREGERTESYVIFFSDGDGETFTWEDVSLADWQRYETGQGVELKLNAFGGISEVEP